MKKILITISAVVCALTGLAAVACGKQEVNYKFDALCEGVIVDDVAVAKGETLTLPVPSRGKNYEFAGWYLTSDFTGSPVTSVVANADTTFYAKWNQLYKVNLNLNGGTLSNADDLYVKAGVNLSAYLAKYSPVKEGYEFGRWLNGNSALPSSMPAAELTLTAAYKVAYTIDVYTQNLQRLLGDASKPEFDKETLTFYDYPKNDFTVEYSLQGFSDLVHENEVLEGALVENPQEGDNSFAIYFKRNQYTVKLNPNVEGTTQQEVSRDFYYGQEYELPYDLYSNAGHIFAGWSESAHGENDYPIDYIDAVLYNGDGSEDDVIREEYLVSGDTTLYAYWSLGYSDLFGGADTIFLLDDSSKNIYLLRGGKYFKGSYVSKDSSFVFYDTNDENIVFDGRILSDNKFCYSSTSRNTISAKAYSFEKGVNDKIRLEIGAYNDLDYVEIDANNLSKTAHGTFTINADEGDFTAVFDSGEGDMVGKTVHFKLVALSGGTGFQIRDDKDYAYGVLPRLVVSNNAIVQLNVPYYTLTLDGYGQAIYYDYDTPTQYYYAYDDEKSAYKLMNAQGTTQGYVRYVEHSGYKGYMFYTPALDVTMNNANPEETDTLTFDGLMNVAYRSGTVAAKGLFSLSSSYFGGYILTFSSNGTSYTFRINQEVSGTVFNPVVTYTFERKPNGYSEYYYYDGKDASDNDVFAYPLLVTDDEVAGWATFYVSVNNKLTKAASGIYEYDSQSDCYFMLLDLDSITEGINYANGRLDLSQISALAFDFVETSAQIVTSRIYYVIAQWGLPAEGEVLGEPTDHLVVYTEATASASGMFLGKIGSLFVVAERNEEVTTIGTYSIVTFNGTDITIIKTEKGYIYVEIDEENGTFIVYESTPYRAYLYREDGTTYRYETLLYDGKSGAVYTMPNPDATGEADATLVYTGTIAEDENGIFLFAGQTEGGATISFRYTILISSSNNGIYFSKISDKEGTFTSTTAGTLTLDGVGLRAVYTDPYNRVYSGAYRARTDEIVYMYLNNEYLYFKLTKTGEKGGTFVLLDSAYGTYIVLDNQIANGLVVALNGEGSVEISQMANEELVPYASGTYDLQDGLVTITFEREGTRKIMKGRTGVIQNGGNYFSTFFVQYTDVAETYVNEADYSVFVFDDAGSATRYTQTGGREYGSYTLLSEDYNILFYINNARTYAAMYRFDPQTRLVSNVENGRLAYFNESFASLRFTEYGFAIFNGEDQYYYYNDTVNNCVTIYYSPMDTNAENAENVAPNKYGFIERKLADGFGNTIEYNGETYYINEGYNLRFTRAQGEEGNYPIEFVDNKVSYKANLTNLTFLPSGAAEFSVTGHVDLSYNSKNYNAECTVVRKAIAGEGNTVRYETYIMIGDFRYDVALSYSPNSNQCTYSVTGMKFFIDAESYNYLYYLYMYQMMLGMDVSSLLPKFGHITIWQDYTVNGEANETTGMLMSAEFGPGMPIYDADGELITSFTAQPCKNNGRGSFTVTITHKTETYIGTFALNTSLGVYAFNLATLYREQKLTYNSQYEVTVGRLVATENNNYTVGNVVALSLKDISGAEPEEITPSDIIKIKGVWHVITRETVAETKRFGACVYYKVDLTERSSETVTQEGVVQPYTSAVVTKIETVQTIYTADGKAYVDIDTATNEVMVFVRGFSYSFIKETRYVAATDTEPDTYIVSTTAGTKYKITITQKDGVKTAAYELLASDAT